MIRKYSIFIIFFLSLISLNSHAEGNAAAGKEKSQLCAACHGVDGKAINFHDADEPEFIGTIAADNPWEFFHKASFGQPGEPMPQGLALGWTLQDIADVIAFAQTLPTE